MKGYYNIGLCGYEVEVNEDCESVTYTFIGTEQKHNKQTAKVYYNSNGEPYFLANRRRVYLHDCVRVNI